MLVSACAFVKIIFERNVAIFVLLFTVMSAMLLCVGLKTLILLQEMKNVSVPFVRSFRLLSEHFFPETKTKT